LGTWKVLEPNIVGNGKVDSGTNSRMFNMATLGSREEEAVCGGSARFLVGYETPPSAAS